MLLKTCMLLLNSINLKCTHAFVKQLKYVDTIPYTEQKTLWYHLIIYLHTIHSDTYTYAYV